MGRPEFPSDRVSFYGDMTNEDARSIIDTRKRKSISSTFASDTRSPPDKRMRQQKHHKLRLLVYPNSIPNEKFEEIERMLFSREDTIDGLTSELADRDRNIRNLKTALASRDATVNGLEARVKNRGQRIQELELHRHDERRGADEQLAKLEAKVKHMCQTLEKQHQQHVAELVDVESQHEEQETAILLASNLLRQAHSERDRLRREVQSRDDRMVTMANQLPGQAARIAMENQAERHLLIMQTLQADLAQSQADVVQGNVLVKDLESKHANALRILAQRQVEITKRDTLLKNVRAEHARDLRAHELNTGRRISAEVKGVMTTWEKRVQVAETKAEAAGRRATQLKEATEDQRNLIARLLEKNEKLAAESTGSVSM